MSAVTSTLKLSQGTQAAAVSSGPGDAARMGGDAWGRGGGDGGSGSGAFGGAAGVSTWKMSGSARAGDAAPPASLLGPQPMRNHRTKVRATRRSGQLRSCIVHREGSIGVDAGKDQLAGQHFVIASQHR